jgi:hypothetical protein
MLVGSKSVCSMGSLLNRSTVFLPELSRWCCPVSRSLSVTQATCARGNCLRSGCRIVLARIVCDYLSVLSHRNC